jgi:hypothetical protein
MALYEYAHDLDTPVHPVSAPDYMPWSRCRLCNSTACKVWCGACMTTSR